MQAESNILGYEKVDNTSVVICSQIKNISNKTIQNSILVTIIYDNDNKRKIKGLGKQNITIEANESKEIASNVECDLLSKDRVKTFLWDSLDNMKPICDVQEMEIN